MNNLNALKKILEVVLHADREFTVHTPLYKIKALFDGLQLDCEIDFNTVYGDCIRTFLEAKRVDKAMKSILGARSVLENVIKETELEEAKLLAEQKTQDNLAVESTCEVVCVTGNNKEIQLQLDNMPKKIGRPKLASALTGAQRAKRARDKKKDNDLVTVNSTLSKHASELYNQMVKSGYDLNEIIAHAYNQAPLKRKPKINVIILNIIVRGYSAPLVE